MSEAFGILVLGLVLGVFFDMVIFQPSLHANRERNFMKTREQKIQFLRSLANPEEQIINLNFSARSAAGIVHYKLFCSKGSNDPSACQLTSTLGDEP